MRAPLVRQLSILLGAATALLAFRTASAQRGDAARIFSGAPEAHWIAPPGMPADSFGVFHARRVIDLATKPTRFLVHVSADNRYRLYVNGVEVSSGPQRSDASHWRYETVDLAPQLVAGANACALPFCCRPIPRARRRRTRVRAGSCSATRRTPRSA